MGRPAFGVDNVMRILLEIAGDKLWVFNPVSQLNLKTGLNKVTLRGYLKELEVAGCVKIYFGPHGMIQKASIEKREVPSPDAVKKPPPVATPAAKIPEPQPPPAPPPPPAPAKAPEPEKLEVPWVVVMADVDNILGTARDAGFNISFAKLKDFCRTYGRILLADAFVSPVSNRPEMIRRLRDSGFHAVACPMASKDKDSVDATIIWRARQYLSATAAAKIVVISRDQDFRDLADFARDLHKETIFVDIARERARVEGCDQAPRLIESRGLARFHKAVDQLARNCSGLNSEEAKLVSFLKEMIKVVDEKERRIETKFSFKSLQDYIWSNLRNSWDRVFSHEEVHAAMNALISKEVLYETSGIGLTYFTLNKTHPAVIRTLPTTATVHS